MPVYQHQFTWANLTNSPFINTRRVDSKNGRFYQVLGENTNTELVRLYSVTTVLGETDFSGKAALEQWRNRIGIESAKKISVYSASRGTSLHKILESFLYSNQIDSDQLMPHLRGLFLSVKNALVDQITKIYCTEQALFSVKLGIAGTVDLVADWNGIPSVIDFKTSKRFKGESEFSKHHLQTTAYSQMWQEHYLDKCCPKQSVIINIMEDSKEPQIDICNDVSRYIPKLLKRIFQFYTMKNENLPGVFC